MASVQPAPGMPPSMPALPPNLSQAQIQEVYLVCTLHTVSCFYMSRFIFLATPDH